MTASQQRKSGGNVNPSLPLLTSVSFPRHAQVAIACILDTGEHQH
jgi:hypothetical protein